MFVNDWFLQWFASIKLNKSEISQVSNLSRKK